MGHLLSTVNPEAVERINDTRPLPDIGEIVHYYPRLGERRRGRDKIAALVTHVDRDNRRLDLAIIHEANDMLDQQRVPERVGEDRGWLRIPTAQDKALEEIAVLRADIADLRAFIMGAHQQPPMTVLDMLKNVDDRVEVLEQAHEAKAQARPAPRKRGRPKKAAAKPAAAVAPDETMAAA